MTLGIVIIGRNEGERLIRCIASVASSGSPVVYVDSGSSDGSVERARSLGVKVVELDMSLPFNAARARNAGFEHLLALEPQTKLVQFIDGDCEIINGWFAEATKALTANPKAAIVCGRLRERFPDKSIYNQLCNLEWDAPIGSVTECGGIAMMQVLPYRSIGGFNSNIIAGEEPELCARLRGAGWEIRRIDTEMALHDAAIYKFSAWWRRSVRGGYAYAQAVQLHGSEPTHYWLRQFRSCVFWGGFLPMAALIIAWPTKGWSLILLSLYPLQWGKLAIQQRRSGRTASESVLRATFFLVAKFAQLRGVIAFAIAQLRRGRVGIIEYKSSAGKPANHPGMS